MIPGNGKKADNELKSLKAVQSPPKPLPEANGYDDSKKQKPIVLSDPFPDK